MKSPEFKRNKKETPKAVFGDGDKIVVNGKEAFRDTSAESNQFLEGNEGFIDLKELNKKSG
jgi:hypothetical protein